METGMSLFSFVSNPLGLGSIPGTSFDQKTDVLEDVVYHLTDGEYCFGDPFGLTPPGWEANGRLRARNRSGGRLIWDHELTVEQGGEGVGVLHGDPFANAVFVFTDQMLLRYAPVE